MRKADPGDGGMEADNASKATTACEALMAPTKVAAQDIQKFQGIFIFRDTSSPPGK